MAVVGLAQELPDSPKATFELGKFTIERKFLVTTNSLLDGPGTVALAPGIPPLFSPYFFGAESSWFMLVRSIDCERRAPNSLWWEVTVHYESPDPKDPQSGNGGGGHGTDAAGGGGGKETQAQFENPLAMVPEIEIHSSQHKEIVYQGYDGSGNPIALSASNGEPFVPAPEKEASRWELRITRNESIVSPVVSTMLTYQNAVNSDIFWGASAGLVKCQSIAVQRLEKNYPDGSTFPYLKVTYVFQFRPDSWDLTILDKGTYYINGSSKRIKFKTDDNQNREGLLDGAGGDGTGGSPHWLTLRVYPRVAFGNLNLPQNFVVVQ